MLFCTVTGSDHLPKAMLMAESIHRYHPNSQIVLCLLEENMHPQALKFPYFDRIVLAKELGFSDFYKFLFKYEIYEAACAIKGHLLTHLLNLYPAEDHFVFVDSDVILYSALHEVEELLPNHYIIVTPHHLTPSVSVLDCWGEMGTLKDGTFNLGFLAIRRSGLAMEFLSWYSSRLERFCYQDLSLGLFLDQKWMNLAPAYFEVHILKHPGYNIAAWNVHERSISWDAMGGYKSNDLPLRFFHYSNVYGLLEGCLNRAYPDTSHIAHTMRQRYVQELERLISDISNRHGWSYDFFHSGERIRRETRIRYRNNLQLENELPNPFSLSNKILS